MYEDLSTFGGLTNKAASQILLSDDVIRGKKSLRQKASDDPSFLTREVVHAEPGRYYQRSFVDFGSSSYHIYEEIMSKHQENYLEIERHYAGPAAQNMARAFDNYRLEGNVYLNEVRLLQLTQFGGEKARSRMLVMLFCCAGCLGKPREAASYVENYSQNRMTTNIVTPRAPSSAGGQAEPPAPRFGIMREANGAVGRVYALDPSGTEIGARPKGPSVVADVQEDVSRQHAIIWFEDGRWVCKGLHSTNGTFLRRGSSDEVVCVEPPRASRKEGVEYPPQEIRLGDCLLFGGQTFFRVVRVMA